MRNFLIRLMTFITGNPRYHPEEYELDKKLHWSRKIWVSNIFRAYEWLFGRGFGIRAELSSSVEERNGIMHVRYELYSFEAHIVHIEVLIRSYISLLKTFLINTLTFQPLPRIDYRPVYVTFGILGLVFSFYTSTKWLPIFLGTIALDTSTKGTNTTTTPETWAHTCTGSNLILIIAGCISASIPTLSTPTYNGTNATLVGSQRTNASVRIGLYFLLAPSTGSNTVSVGFGGTFPASDSGAVSWSGVAQSGQPDAVNGNTGTTANPDLAVTTVADNCWAVGLLGVSGFNAPTAGLTSRQNFSPVNGGFSSKGNLEDTNASKTPAGSQSVNWTLGVANSWAGQAASFAPAGSASTSTGNFFAFFRP